MPAQAGMCTLCPAPRLVCSRRGTLAPRCARSLLGSLLGVIAPRYGEMAQMRAGRARTYAQVKALPLSGHCDRPAGALLLDLVLQLIEKLLILFKLLLNQLVLPP